MTKATATLAAVMAVKNEESKIRKCLENLKGFVDEIIVVDMHSSDRTREICREYTDKVFQHDGGPLGLIPVNKQFGFHKVSSDWILIVDADFFYEPDCKAEIRTAVDSGGAFAAYRLSFKNLWFGKWPRHAFGLSRQVLLFKKGCGRYDGKTAHDALVIDGTIGEIHTPFYHLGHPTIENYVSNMNRYTSQDAALIIDGGVSGFSRIDIAHVTWRQVLWRPTKTFLWVYVRNRGYKDGLHGFIIAVLLSFHTFLEIAKAYELIFKKRTNWTIDTGPDW